MNGDDKDKELREQFADVLDRLRPLAAHISRQRHPGLAWPVRRVHRPRRVLWWAAAAGIAAAIALVIVMHWPAAPTRVPPTGPDAEIASTTPAAPEANEVGLTEINVALASAVDPSVLSQVSLSGLSDLDLSVAGQITFEVPSLSMPSDANDGGYHWTIPSVSLPSQEERSQSNGT
jgi:hypothetical protein